MSKISNVLICGLGAIGTIYAVAIQKSGFANLKILVDSQRLKRYTDNPICYNEKKYFFDYILDADRSFKADLIIIATKNQGLAAAVKSIKNFVSENTIILSLLNGISSEEEIEKFYPGKTLYSYFVGHTSSRTGSCITFDGVGEIVLGEKYNKSFSDRVNFVSEFFDSAGINYSVPEDMEYSMWKKFLVNVGTNQASAILGGEYYLFHNSEKSMNFAKALMKEASAIAQKSGVKNAEQLLPQAVDIIKSMLPNTKSSMLQDIEAKRETEVDIFAGKVIELGKKYNISTPYNTMAFEIIKALDEKSKIYNQVS